MNFCQFLNMLGLAKEDFEKLDSLILLAML
jgi:hypothetical protein